MNELIAVIASQFVAFLFLLIWVVYLLAENSRLRDELSDREKWHEKEIVRWRNRL